MKQTYKLEGSCQPPSIPWRSGLQQREVLICREEKHIFGSPVLLEKVLFQMGLVQLKP